MLRLNPYRKLGVNAIPAHLTTLSLSWLNNQFKAVAVHKGAVEAAWERPGETEGADHFETFLREAIHETGYRGHTVSMVLAHPRLVQQLTEVPPVKGAPLAKVLQRQAQQQKVFPGEAAWASQASLDGRGVQRAILHLFPSLLLNQFIQGCKRNGLHLNSVLPPSAVLHHQITQLPLQKDEVALLAAATGGSTTLVIGRSDGQIVLARTLPGDWNQEAERLALDLNRTILFVSQQYGVAVNQGAWLFGPGASEKIQTLQRTIQVPVRLSTVEYDPFYWATEALKLRPELIPNFISTELQKAPQRRAFAKAVAAATCIVVGASLASSAFFMAQARREAANSKALSAQETRLEIKRRDLQLLDSELTRKKEIVKVIIHDRPPPTPAWMLAWLGQAVPSDLVVTNFQIKRHEGAYKVRLEGTLQTPAASPASQLGADPVHVLKTRLTGAPFHLKLLEDGPQKAAAARTGSADSQVPGWLSRVTKALGTQPIAARGPAQDHFLIEGVVR